MKTVLDDSTRKELLERIQFLSSQNHAQWGKMNLFQMLKHCSLCDDMFLGEIKIKRVFAGRVLGKMVLRKVLKDEKPFGKNSPTSSVLKVKQGTGNIDEQKREWANRIEQYGQYNNPDFVHPFFGRMTKEQVGFLAYKHADHHLRQFGG